MALTEKEISKAEDYLTDQFFCTARYKDFGIAGIGSHNDGVVVLLKEEISEDKKQAIRNGSTVVGRQLNKSELQYRISGSIRAA